MVLRITDVRAEQMGSLMCPPSRILGRGKLDGCFCFKGFSYAYVIPATNSVALLGERPMEAILGATNRPLTRAAV
jgi:hypothetical protein